MELFQKSSLHPISFFLFWGGDIPKDPYFFFEKNTQKKAKKFLKK
jgi:hypothetical protein